MVGELRSYDDAIARSSAKSVLTQATSAACFLVSAVNSPIHFFSDFDFVREALRVYQENSADILDGARPLKGELRSTFQPSLMNETIAIFIVETRVETRSREAR